MAQPQSPELQKFAAECQAKLNGEMEEIKKIQIEVQKVQGNKAQLTEKRNENELVMKEFDIIGDEAVVFKLVGPIMAKQELSEAKSNVKARIDFLETEINRIGQLEKDFEDRAKAGSLRMTKIQEEFKAKAESLQAPP